MVTYCRISPNFLSSPQLWFSANDNSLLLRFHTYPAWTPVGFVQEWRTPNPDRFIITFPHSRNNKNPYPVWLVMYIYIYAPGPATPPLPPPAWDGSHIEIFPLPPCGVVGVWYCPPPPLWCGGGVVWYVGYVWCVWSVWYGMFGKYGCMVGMVCMACMFAIVCMVGVAIMLHMYGICGMYDRYDRYGMHVIIGMYGRCGIC